MEKTYFTNHRGLSVVRFIFTGEDKAADIATALVRQSAWFELTPLPDDEWCIDVKIENERFVERAWGEE